jgi:hypothetical protein
MQNEPPRGSPIKFFSWLAGQRVSRKDADHLGTVLETMPKLKVQWDSAKQAISAATGQPTSRK